MKYAVTVERNDIPHSITRVKLCLEGKKFVSASFAQKPLGTMQFCQFCYFNFFSTEGKKAVQMWIFITVTCVSFL